MSAIPNELIKTGGTDGRQIGSKVLIDSSKHMTQLSRMTLETGQSLSQHGLDLHGANITRANEIDVEILRAKQIIGPVHVSAQPPPPPPSTVTEFPDDMVVESLQCASVTVTQLPNMSLIATDTQGQLTGQHLSGNSALVTDASGRIITTTDLGKFVSIPAPLLPPPPTYAPNSALVTDASGHVTSTADLTKFVTFPPPTLPPSPPTYIPNSALVTDASGHVTSTSDLTKFVTFPAPNPSPPPSYAPNSALMTDAKGNIVPTTDLTKFVTLPSPSPPPPAKLEKMTPNANVVTDEDGELTTVALDTFVRCPVASLMNHIPRFATTNGMLASSSVYVDGEGNMSGLNKIEALRADLGEIVNTDTLQSVLTKSKSIETEKINLGNTFLVTSYSTNLYVSNGAFQSIGIGGEGSYVINLKFGSYSIYCQTSIGKTKVGFRTAFGPIGGVKSSQLVEYESQNGYDFVQMDIPEVGKINFGAEQKSGEFAIRSDQVDLINVDIYVQRSYVMVLQSSDD